MVVAAPVSVQLGRLPEHIFYICYCGGCREAASNSATSCNRSSIWLHENSAPVEAAMAVSSVVSLASRLGTNLSPCASTTSPFCHTTTMAEQPPQHRTTHTSRERNRIHARKTRQRKKEQMLNLQERAEELKQEQLALKQIINEKNTASILVGLFATSANQNKPGESSEDPRVEALLRRPAEEIPDATKIPELPALILPGQHASRKARAEAKNCALKESEFPSDGIDYELLGRDRSKCTPEELDRIRRERNRMHAKRTRDRKRLFMEEMGEMCRQLEEENDLLLKHLKSIDPDFDDSKLPKRRAPEPTPEGPTLLSPKFVTKHHRASPTSSVSSHPSLVPSRFMQGNQLKALLDVAGSFGRTDNGQHVSTLLSVATAITGASDSDSSSLSSGDMDRRPAKRVKSH